jgi:acetyl-CoA carboxylase alpha subunit
MEGIMKLIARFPVAVLTTIRTVGSLSAHVAEKEGLAPRSLFIRTVFK